MLELCKICLSVTHSENTKEKRWGVVLINHCKDCLLKKKIQ